MRKWALIHHFFFPNNVFRIFSHVFVFIFVFYLYFSCSPTRGKEDEEALMHHFFLPNNVCRLAPQRTTLHEHSLCPQDHPLPIVHINTLLNTKTRETQKKYIAEYKDKRNTEIKDNVHFTWTLIIPLDHPLPRVHANTSLSTNTGRTQNTLYMNTHYAPPLTAPIHNLHVKKNTNPKIKTKTT